MIKEKYLKELTDEINKFDDEKKFEVFIFGSSLQRDNFGDIDIGIMGDVKDKEVIELKERFGDSTFPYFVEVINFNKVSEKFKENVFNNKVLWIRR